MLRRKIDKSHKRIYRMAIKKGVRRNGIGLLARIEQGRATGSARGKDGEARELLRICRVHV